ncbi:MAG TPA: carboxymuconolactone decarboxylase family protein [Gaiellaceae bacterium]|nr:carboxymuconolactone decarboxylase family protein [Gaiellaceae bacterium]
MRIPPEERAQRGREAYASQFGISPDEVDGWFAERYGERFGEEAVNAAAGAWADDELSLRDRSLIVVAALIVQGEAGERLRGHVRWAVEHGATRAELEALGSLLAVYAGYPRAAAGLEIVRAELDRIDDEGGTT